MMTPCDCCRFDGVELQAETYGIGPRARTLNVCDLCRKSNAGNAFGYPEQYSQEARTVLAAICYVGNTVLAAAKEAAER